jgi:benzoyl-CoA reductase subunit B
MLVQKPEKLWETRPLDCWAQAKELRKRFYDTEKAASKRRMFLIGGGDGPQQGMGPGFGNFHIVHPHPEAASIANTSDSYSRQCRAATEMYGCGRDLCGYQLDYIGALLTNKHFSGGEMPRRDFVVQGNDMCAMFPKLGQLEAEFWDVPEHHSDTTAYYDEHDPERDKAISEYVANQTLETIEWLEKALGTKFDDEAYIESIKRNWRMSALRGDVIECLCHVPSPLDQKSAYSLFTLGGLVGSDPEDTEKFWVNFRDEMRWRNENNIAALATERYRWTENEPPPWFFLRYYRYMEEYGAICIQTFYQGVTLEEQPDGTFKRPKTPLDRGVELKTREDAVRYGGMGPPPEGGRKGSAWGGHGPLPQTYFDRLMNSVKAFKCDGAILTLHRAGIGCVYSMKATAVKMMEAGIPVMHYETSHPGDRTDFDETRMLDQLDVFMETQGLRKLEQV